MIDDIAGAGVVTDAGAATDTGAGDGTPAEGGEPGGTPGGTPESTETPAEGGESGEEEPPEGGEPEPEPESDTDDFEMDGRRVDDRTRKSLAALKKIDPQSAKLVSEIYHRSQQIIKDTGTSNISEAMQKVRGMSATMEALGGEEGITELNQKVVDYDREIEQFGNGDTVFIEGLWEANPKGLELSTAASLNVLASKNADAFDRVAIPAIVQRLESAGMYNAMKNLSQLIIDGKGQEAYDLLQSATKWMTDAKALQKQQLEVKDRKDPEREKLDTDRAELAKEKAAHYDSQINSHLNTLCNKSLARTVEPFFKELKLPTEGRREFVNALQSRIWKAQKEDKTFQLQAKTIKAKGDPQAVAEFAAANFTEKLPEQFRRLRNQLYPSYKPGVTPISKNGAPPPKAPAPQNGKLPEKKVVDGGFIGPRPKNGDVDWDQTDTIMWTTGRAVLKTGKRITFDINSAPNKITY